MATVAQYTEGLLTRNGASYQGLNVFPICVTSREFENPLGLTSLEEGMKSGRLKALETADMSFVQLKNRGESVAVICGETLIGGGQNRMINCGMVLSHGEGAEVPSSCVEIHRWDCKSGKDDPIPDDKKTFERSDAVFGGLKRVMTISSLSAMRSNRAIEPDQKKVWECVTEAFGTSGARTKSLDMHDLYDFWDAPLKIFSSRFAIRPGQVGIVVFTSKKTWFADIFGDADLLHKNYKKLIKGYSLDALLNLERDGTARPYSVGVDDAKNALKALKPALIHPLDAKRHKGSGFFESGKFCGTLLSNSGRLVHLSACSK